MESKRFKRVDLKGLNNVEKGVQRKSMHLKVWAIQAFDEWREFKGYNIDQSIVGLSEEKDNSNLIDLLL